MNEYYEIDFKGNKIEQTLNSSVVVNGVGKMFGQIGFYNSLATLERGRKKGYKISWLNCTRELQRDGWSAKSILSTFREINCLSKLSIDIEQI